MVDLNKGATVELVKTLSDDIRTLPDGTKATSAGTAVRKIDVDLNYTNTALGIGRKIIKGHFVNSSGVIVEGQQYDVCCFYVKDKITQLYSPAGLAYAFFTSEPQIGSTSYNNARTVSLEETVASNLPVPNGTNWIALRVPAGEVATISPISTELNEIKDMFLNTALSLGEYTDSLDNVKDNSVRYIPSSVDSSPFYGKSACVLCTSIMIPETYLQTAIGITGGNKGKQYVRTFISSAWTDWVSPLNDLSDDIRTLPDGTKATSAGAAVRKIDVDLNYTNTALGIGRKIIKGHFVNSSGVIEEGQQYDVCCFYVKDKITQLYSPGGLVYAFFTSEPQIGSTSYNNARTVSLGVNTASNLPVPDGTNWIALRVPAGEVATISPISTELNEIKNMFLNTALSLGEYTDSLDNVKDNSVRYIPSSVDSSPFYGKSACVLCTSIMIPGTYLQTAIGITGGNKGKQYVRTFISSAWTDWVSPLNDMFLNTTLSLGEYTGSLDNVKDNSLRYIPSSVDSSPFYEKSACVLQTNIIIPNAYFQTAYGFSIKYKGVRYVRTYAGGSWSDWVARDMGDMFSSKPSYFAFGDSVTYGAKWVSTQTEPYYQIIQTPEHYRIPTRIAHAIGADISFANKGVSGAYFVGNDSNKILTAIQSTDLSGAKLITVAGGRNDSSNSLGNKNSTASDGTICGAVKEIIEYLQSNYKKAQIIWIGVTPHSNNNSTVFTNTFAGNWSINDFDEQVSAVCAQYCVPYVGWKECSLMTHWSDFTSAAGNYVHPDSDDVYLQMGNYIAGRVASYYRG